jgi:hypothetical protein
VKTLNIMVEKLEFYLCIIGDPQFCSWSVNRLF